MDIIKIWLMSNVQIDSYRNSITKTPDHKVLCIFPPNSKTLKDMYGYSIIAIRAYVLLETGKMPLFGVCTHRINIFG